ncbi:cupredoxin domain-containing protein [Cohnella faecalis]|uniref:Cytochrome C oxidase subunit II n=1 Tax=Cohnella faecalis TaxID=2315694 RepID=A0A398CUZ5_9BACL|nr:cupredoxin domain-containing protein [Cohnella faecalis]RIE03687.1 cytochrome C oxidase subunit II [Cohnella faecalis]
MKTKHTVFSLLSIAALAMALSACGGNNDDNAASSAPASPSASSSASASAPAAGGETKEITITASNWKFDQTDIKVHKGDTIKLTLKNESGMHAIAIDDLNVEVKSGETKEFTVTDAGTFEFHCSITCGQGHDNMSGNIVVE